MSDRTLPTTEASAFFDEAVKASFDDSGGTPGTYGSHRVWEGLVAAGWKVSRKTVAAATACQGLAGRSPKRKRRCLTRPDKAADPIPDLIRRDFNSERVDQRWCGDLTEIPTQRALPGHGGGRGVAAPGGLAVSEQHDSALVGAQVAGWRIVAGGCGVEGAARSLSP